MIRMAQRLEDLPNLSFWEIMQGRASSPSMIAEWLREHNGLLREDLHRFGAILIKGFKSICDEGPFNTILSALGTPMADYVGGSTPRTRLLGNIYTATELPRQYSVPLHQEMAYLPRFPIAVVFLCMEPASLGGETTIADARDVTKTLDANIKRSFDQNGINIRRMLPTRGSLYSATGVSRPWQDVFGTSDRRTVERLAADRAWKISWRKDGGLYLWHQGLPAFRTHPHTQDKLWFNQAHNYAPECMIRWAIRDERSSQRKYLQRLQLRNPDALNKVSYADDTLMPSDAFDHIWDVLVSAEKLVRWERGAFLVLDNMLTMHGRHQFIGKRRILAGLLETLELNRQ